MEFAENALGSIFKKAISKKEKIDTSPILRLNYSHTGKIIKNHFKESAMKYSTSVRPISYLKAHASEILRHLDEDRQPLIITQNGEAKAALLDIHEYEEIMESLAMLKLIAQSKKSISEDKVKPFRDVFKSIKGEASK
jgi:prevent-host-death family protein